MENVYNTIYNLINDINAERNAINKLFYTDSLIVGDMMYVSNGNTTINTPVDILNTTQLELNASNTCALYVAGGAHIDKNLLVNGNIYCKDDFYIDGNFIVSNILFSNKELIVLGNTIATNINANSIIANIISGNVTNLNIKNGANINTLNANKIIVLDVTNFISDSLSINKLNITNIASFNNINANIIGVASNLTTNYANITQDANIGNNLRVLGGANISGNVNVDGNMQVFGNLEVKNNIKLNGNVNIYGALNLYNSNVTLYNKIISNNDLVVKGTLFCNDIYSNGSLNITGYNDVVANIPLYSNLNQEQMFANIEFTRENRFVTLRTIENISGTIKNTTPFIYANLANITDPDRFTPIKFINKNNTLIDGTNVGYNWVLSGNVNGNLEFINMFYPDYTVNNIGTIRFSRLNRIDWILNHQIEIYKFNYSFLV
jgi:cytoskeletal protein CcmA (bactofilin family)